MMKLTENESSSNICLLSGYRTTNDNLVKNSQLVLNIELITNQPTATIDTVCLLLLLLTVYGMVSLWMIIDSIFVCECAHLIVRGARTSRQRAMALASL